MKKSINQQKSNTKAMKCHYKVDVLRCVYIEYEEIFRTYSDIGYETVRGYDVKLRHYPRHSRIQSLGALQNNRLEAKLFGFELCERYFRQLLRSKI